MDFFLFKGEHVDPSTRSRRTKGLMAQSLRPLDAPFGSEFYVFKEPKAVIVIVALQEPNPAVVTFEYVCMVRKNDVVAPDADDVRVEATLKNPHVLVETCRERGLARTSSVFLPPRTCAPQF